MSIKEEFAGLDMGSLIGGPLSAAADASLQLANSTAEFINKVGFDEEGKTRTAAFSYQKHSINDDGTSNLDEMKIDVPMLAIVPIPNLQVDEVNVLFDMEVKQSEKEEKSMDLGATVSGSMNFGIVKVNVSGSVSAHSSNTRSTDNSAKYHVDVRASNHGIPEGLARVLDIMASNISPSLVSSTLKNGNGQDLTETARARAEKMKRLREEISQCEGEVSAAKSFLDNTVVQMKKLGTSQENAYLGTLTNLLGKEATEEQQEEYKKSMDEISRTWNGFVAGVGEAIKMLAAKSGEEKDIFSMFTLKKVTLEGKVEAYAAGEDYYDQISAAGKEAVSGQQTLEKCEESLLSKKKEYNKTMIGTEEKAADNSVNPLETKTLAALPADETGDEE